MSDPPPQTATSNRSGQDAYRIGFPDGLEVLVEGRPELSGAFEVQANGCIDLGPLGGVRVEGLPTTDVEPQIARLSRVRREQVRVRVARFRSQQVYLVGEVRGDQRAVPYQGPESVVDLLRRVGGITPESAPSEITIIRDADLTGDQPQVIRVDLREVLLQGNPRTNVVVRPYDQIRVPESKRSRVGKAVHPWLKRISDALQSRS